MNELITFQRVDKTYEMTSALKNINFTINEKEFVVILGPSGAGKSTLLNLLGGLDQPSTGDIWVQGINIAEFNENELADYRAKKVGFIFQFYNLLPTLNALDNVNLVHQVNNSSLNGENILQKVGLAEKMRQYPSELSGGEQQRVSIARAIAKNAPILLCDEPTGALDTQTGKQIMKLLKSLNRQGKTVIVVTHNEEFSVLANKVIRLKDGEIESIESNLHPSEAD
ncbi:ABC transporter ATP-binding protein [Xylocopilactobacillus apicola]|uniref:ABC transporter ATP-binding protein n=1 Tax=Xylocopilactobacillus apicola TaxID=2932184 RepID=A0AAU9DGN8_9LACO|nr:ABC transporter ATP-binding protein [Xylocopilactobacillus apicola]BDR59130.1 ABC transporter ATP-binding protein [Xylocopilactobacillus apicola]